MKLLPDWLKEQAHNCEEVLNHLTVLRNNLRGIPLLDTEVTYFTDRSSYLEKGERVVEEAVVDEGDVT